MLRRAIFLTIAVCAAAAGASPIRDSLWDDFVTPPDSAKPWCYWWWINGHVDKETITADLEAMKRLGFGGILLFDSRGYFDDEEHVVNPKAEIGWGTKEWYDLVEFSIRECARLGLEYTMNASASGGTLNGFIDGKEYETDIMNRDEVIAHLDRAVGPILKRVPNLVVLVFGGHDFMGKLLPFCGIIPRCEILSRRCRKHKHGRGMLVPRPCVARCARGWRSARGVGGGGAARGGG